MRAHLFRLLMVLLALAALYLAYRTLRQYSWDEIKNSFAAIPAADLLLSVSFMVFSYVTLTGFDTLALRYLGKELAYRRIALAAFTSLAIGHNVGVAALSSGAIRYRFYSKWGLGAAEVGTLIVFCGMTVALGQLTLAGLAFLIRPDRFAGFLNLPAMMPGLVGGGMLAAVAAYVGLCFLVRRTLTVRRFVFTLPSGRMACAQVVLGTLNYLFVGGCLYHLVKAGGDIGFFQTAGAFVMANLVAIVTHVPGGIGIIEATIAFLLRSPEIGAIIAFRAIYFFLPLPFALICLALGGVLERDEEPVDGEKRAASARLAAKNHR